MHLGRVLQNYHPADRDSESENVCLSHRQTTCLELIWKTWLEILYHIKYPPPQFSLIHLWRFDRPISHVSLMPTWARPWILIILH